MGSGTRIAGAERFATDAKLARTAARPRPRQLRTTHSHRLDRGGNRQLNSALHRLAITKARLDPETTAHLARKQAEGKTRREAIRCLKRHLARRVWHLLSPDPATTIPTITPTRRTRSVTIHCNTPTGTLDLTRSNIGRPTRGVSLDGGWLCGARAAESISPGPPIGGGGVVPPGTNVSHDGQR